MPKIFPTPDDIDRPVIVKFHGAGGGDGYFLAKTKEECKQKLQAFPGAKYQIQEYIIGVPIYIHYFHSPLTGEVELLGFDKRYETNVDGIGRIGAADQQAMGVQPSYTVVGNIPLVVRESLLPEAIKMGKQVVQRSKELAAPGLFGPFCLEGILTPNKEFIIFEISARIVAGTNPYVAGSPYTALRYNEPMSTGRRIAREIKLALEQGKMNLVLQ